jgi:hypothetical protein
MDFCTYFDILLKRYQSFQEILAITAQNRRFGYIHLAMGSKSSVIALIA